MMPRGWGGVPTGVCVRKGEWIFLVGKGGGGGLRGIGSVQAPPYIYYTVRVAIAIVGPVLS